MSAPVLKLPVSPLDARAELEARAGLRSLDALHATRSALVAEVAPLASLYGPFGGWDATRKIMLSVAELRVRDEAAQAEVKLTEGKVDALAHVRAEYKAFIEQSNLDRARYIVLNDAIESISEQIRRDGQWLYYLQSEPK